MENGHVIIIGGGLAGLSAGCYARANGFATTIVEHNLALGGVCQAWSRGRYTIDGCIHWLTGGPFDQVYRELGIYPKLSVHTLDLFASYRNLETQTRIDLGRDLDAFERALTSVAPEDADEVARLVAAAKGFTTMDPGVDQPPELASLRESLRRVWEIRGELPELVHFRKPFGVWARERLKSETLRRYFEALLPAEAPAFFLLMMLGYLGRGWLSRPDGGSGRFRDALIESYHALGGTEYVHATVDEILVEHDRAYGVRLADGTLHEADYVISTSSMPETALRLLGGRYGADDVRNKLEHWKLFDPVALVSFGVAAPLRDVPPTLLLDRVAAFDVGGKQSDRLHLRIFNDDPGLAPPGHTVVQAVLTSDYAHWATRGTSYSSEKDELASRVLRLLEEQLPALRGNVEVTDVATPLTYWTSARAWRGAFEGWMPSGAAFFSHVQKTLPGLSGLYMAGQWVEPGGGVPSAVMSGRQVVQLLCSDTDRPFELPRFGFRG
jgi:phytoene dehydrogenase-like protein